MPESLYLTVNLIDRFLAIQPVIRKKLQLVGITRNEVIEMVIYFLRHYIISVVISFRYSNFQSAGEIDTQQTSVQPFRSNSICICEKAPESFSS